MGNLALEVTAQLARTLAIAVDDEDGKLSRRGLQARIDKLIGAVQRAQTILQGIEGARRGLDDAEDAYHSLVEEAMALLLELQDKL